ASQPKCGSNILLRVGVALSQSACGRDSTPAGMKNASQSHEKNSRASSTLTIITEKNPCACAIGISPASTPAASRYLRRGEGGREGETESVSILTCFPVTFSPCRLVSLFFYLPICPSRPSPLPPSPPPPLPHPPLPPPLRLTHGLPPERDDHRGCRQAEQERALRDQERRENVAPAQVQFITHRVGARQVREESEQSG